MNVAKWPFLYLLMVATLYASFPPLAQAQSDPWQACKVDLANHYECFDSLDHLIEDLDQPIGAVRPWRVQFTSPSRPSNVISLTLGYYEQKSPIPVGPPRYFMDGDRNHWVDLENICAQGDGHQDGCINEDELISNYEARYRENFCPSCDTEFILLGAHHDLSDYVRYDAHRTFQIALDNWTGDRRLKIIEHSNNTSWEVTITKRYAVECDEPYLGLPVLGTGPSVLAWDQLCEGGGQAYAAVFKSQVASCAANANPCFPGTGDKARYEEDANVFGMPFVRSYHSLRLGEDEYIGVGWSHTYSERIITNGQDVSYALDEFGLYDIYELVQPGVYASRLHPGRTIRPIAGYLEMTGPNEATKKFDGNGRLLKIIPAFNRAEVLTLTYDSSGLLLDIVDLHGRSLQFDYTKYRGVPVLSGVILPDGHVLTYSYDGNGNFEAVQFDSGEKKTYLYDESGSTSSIQRHFLTGIVSESGQKYASFGYDERGRVISSKLHTGIAATPYAATTTVSYPGGAIADVMQDTGSVRRYIFKNWKYFRLSSISFDGSFATNQYYHGLLESHTDYRGNVTSYARDAFGRSIQVAEAVGITSLLRTNDTDWDASAPIPTERRVLDSTGTIIAKENWSYNARGQALTQAHADPVANTVRTTTVTYCEQSDVTAGTCPLLGLVTSINGPGTDVVDTASYTYYSSDDVTCATVPTTCPHRKGDLWKVTNAIGQVTETLAYDGAGRVLSVKDANGVITDMQYHPRGWLTARKVRGTNNASETDDQITTIDYWPTGLVKQVTQADGAYTAYTYDAAHRLTDITDNAGNTIHYALDNAGNRIQEDTKDTGGVLKRSLSRVYNQLGQLATQADADASPTDFSYDANGNTDTVTDALGRVTDNDYDPLNRLARTLQDVGGIQAETTFTYDARDNLTKVTDPKGLESTYTYNGLGDLTQLASPDTGTTTYTYDSAGNRKTQTDARGKVSTYGYDALNRLTGITYPTTSLNVVYTYDTNQGVCGTGETFSQGRLTKLKDASGTTQYCFDRFGNLVRKLQTTNGKAFTVRYAHTKAGQLSSMTYPDGAIVDYVRDAQGRVTEVGTTPAGSVRQVLLNQVAYYPFGPSAGWTYGNGRNLQRTFNLNYQPETVLDGNTGGLSLGYAFDAIGNLTQLNDGFQSTIQARYAYDALYRLSDTKDGPTGTVIEHYGYDATGNRTSLTNAGGTAAYTYPATSHRLTKAGAVARTYDAAGNTTKIGGTARQFVYDDMGRMKQVKAGSTVTMNYKYNGRGEQVRKYLGTANTYTVYDEAGHWLGDYDSTGAAIQQAVWMDDQPVGLLVGASTNQALHYIEPDHLGSPRVVIDPTRDVAVWKWDAKGEAFGNTPPDQNPDGDANGFVFNMRFPGQRYDAASGLNQNGFRDYEAATGRYPQSDPIGLRGGVSTYGYALQDPLGAVDPSGLAAYLVPVPPGNQRPAGSIYCVDGVIKPYFNYDLWPKDFSECKEVGDCLRAHEMSHVADAYRSSPGLCRKSPLHFLFGTTPMSVTFSNDPYPGSNYSELDVSELSAHTVELYCLMSKLKGMTGQCNDKCKAAVIRRIRQITHGSLPAIRDGTY